VGFCFSSTTRNLLFVSSSCFCWLDFSFLNRLKLRGSVIGLGDCNSSRWGEGGSGLEVGNKRGNAEVVVNMGMVVVGEIDVFGTGDCSWGSAGDREGRVGDGEEVGMEAGRGFKESRFSRGGGRMSSDSCGTTLVKDNEGVANGEVRGVSKAEACDDAVDRGDEGEDNV